jgi:hypothetical protein
MKDFFAAAARRLPLIKDIVAASPAIRQKLWRDEQQKRGDMSAEALQAFLALAIGFSFAAAMATGYQLAVSRPPSFQMLSKGPSPSAFAAVPFLVFAAPYLIVRLLVRAGLAGPQEFGPVMVATMFAGIWSLMSGTVLMMMFQAAYIYLH